MKPSLTDADYQKAAALIGCDVPAIKAVSEVESSGSGFLPDDRPRILFEAHIFSRLTTGIYDKDHPGISSPFWNRTLYKGGVKEHDRLGEACALNRKAGLQSASWGRFQIMGFNYSSCGFKELQDFINAMYRSEADHLVAFIAFIQGRGLDGRLRDHQWDLFARGYNGAAYAENHYAEKLAKAYALHGGTS